MNIAAKETFEKIETIKEILVDCSTGTPIGEYDDQYRRLRIELIADKNVSEVLPGFVRDCRTLKEFWSFIKSKSESYSGRTSYLGQEFNPLLNKLEAQLIVPQSTATRVSNEKLIASAAQFLIAGGQEDAASVLLSCSLHLWDEGSWMHGESLSYYFTAELRGPRAAFDVLKDTQHPVSRAIHEALNAVLPRDEHITDLVPAAEVIEIEEEWRKELLEIARGRGVSNQGPNDNQGRSWLNLKFRSQSEVRIAQALERAGALYLPNCRARLSDPEGKRVTREPDFLVCYEGKWGILEVDGEPFHPASRAAHDHARDRLFKAYGVLVIDHVDAGECYESPDKVVKRFIEILSKA